MTFTKLLIHMDLDGVQSLEKDCVRAFRHADEDDKGFLTPTDYKVAVLELCGYKPSKYEINAVWSKLSPPPVSASNTQQCPDVETAGNVITDFTSDPSLQGVGINQPTFVSMMVERLGQKDKDELIRQVFIAFDVHLRGFITTSDCIQAFKEVSPHISEELVGRWFDEVDSDSDGRVTFRDSEMMMKSHMFGDQVY